MNWAGRSEREEALYRQYIYEELDEGREVLRNKLNLRTVDALDGHERIFVEKRLAESLPDDARELSSEGVKAIHRHMFQDVYEWAGELRDYPTGRGPAPFALPRFIDASLDQLFNDLEADDYLQGLDADAFAEKAAAYVNELNAIHPFIDGNGRMQRTWLRNLAEQAGHDLTLTAEDRERWNEASATGFHSTNKPMQELLSERIAPLADRERERRKDREHDR